MNTKKAVFGGGCFWCTEAVFKMLKGVSAVMPGYAGGSSPNPTYEQVSGGDTGYAEVIEVTYDPIVTTYRELLDVFFASHDGTQMNRQGNDVGTQYRSVIFYNDEGEKVEAEKYITELKARGVQAVTSVEPLTHFYPAEDYHKDYFANNRSAPYCQIIIEPKVEKIKNKFADKIK